MPWWMWIALAGALIVVLTRRWNPVSRVAAADTLGRRWAMLVHFWPIWRVAIAVGIVAVAILIAAHPGRHAATAPPAAGKASPTVATRTRAASPAPSPVASPVAVPTGGRRFPVVAITVAAGVATIAVIAVVLAMWWRRGADPDYWLAASQQYLDDDETADEPDDADGWPPGSGPEPDDSYDTEDENDGNDGDDDAGEYDPAAGGVVGAGTVRGIHDRGHGRARRS